jgi:hypothetical protein
MNYAVLWDRRFDRARRHWDVDVTLEGHGSLAAPVSGLLDDGVEAAVVLGDDFTLSRLATALHEELRDDARRFELLPVDVGEVCTVAQAIEAPGTGWRDRRRTAKALNSADLRRTRVPSLRVVDSALASARLGFAFGMGTPFDYFEARARSERGRRLGALESVARLTRDTLRDSRGRAVEADIFVDWEPSAERFGYFVATPLERTWFDVAMGRGATYRVGRRALELVGARSKVGRVVENATGAGAEQFQRVHIDTNSGYVVDGELFDPRRPRTVAITDGPRVHCLIP